MCESAINAFGDILNVEKLAASHRRLGSRDGGLKETDFEHGSARECRSHRVNEEGTSRQSILLRMSCV
jgi:hypothetical protein